MKLLGLDIGGANLKAAHRDGAACSQPFELWRSPDRLGDALRDLIRGMPSFDQLAVTMTGELCDCFESRRQGVLAILSAVETVAQVPVRVWSRKGFVDLETARRNPLEVGSANWLALANFACRHIADCGLLLDVGSTTTDLVPLVKGKPAPRALDDIERLRSLELIYTGVRRTPLYAVLGGGVAAELFATTLDVHLLLESIPENVEDHNTADGRPATKAAAVARLARMLCADVETVEPDQIRKLAERALLRQVYQLGMAFEHVAGSLPEPPTVVVLAGEGEFLARLMLTQQNTFRGGKIVSLSQELGPEISRAACAYASAILANE